MCDILAFEQRMGATVETTLIKRTALAGLTAIIYGAVLSATVALAGPLTSNWSVGHKSKARLLVGSLPTKSGKMEIYAGVEIVLAPDWKTYWRQPGDAGGVPPYFDWSKSVNLARTDVLFPAPHRFTDATGDAIGYKKSLILPVRIEPQVRGRKIGLALNFQYGVCREICIPAQAKLAMEVQPDALRTMPPQLAEAIERVPLSPRHVTASSPRLLRATPALTAKPAKLTIDVAYPGGSEGADLFLDAGAEVYLPMARKTGSIGPNQIRYEVDLSDGIDLAALRGKDLRLTMVSARHNAEAVYRLP